jgi:hypothetical protein
MENPPPSEVQQVGLQRALIIGLGGTGAEVIYRLRRHLIEHYGSFDRLPIVEFLYIDTNPEWFTKNQSEIEKDIRLDTPQMVDAQVPDASNLYRGIANGTFSNYPWFSLDQLHDHKNVVFGAGTIRQLGRLLLPALLGYP